MESDGLNGQDTTQLDSLLSYVAGRDGNKGPSLFDKEVRSWLMMATELVPSSSTQNQFFSSNAAAQESQQSLFPSNMELDHIPYNLESPVISSNLYGASPSALPMDSVPGEMRHNSIDLMPLPDPLLPNTAFSHQDLQTSFEPSGMQTTAIPAKQIFQPIPNSSIANQTSIFSAPPVDQTDIYTSLPLPDVNFPTVKREHCETYATSPYDEFEGIGDAESEKRQKRLAKNREIAKNCRRRKKEKKAAIEEEILHLRQENSKLRHQLESLHKDSYPGQQNVSEHHAFIQRLKQCIASSDESGILREINEYYKTWTDMGSERSAAAQIHLEQLKMLLLPTQMTKMCLWSMGQEDEFYDEKLNNLKYGGGIWNLLSAVVQFTEEQKKAIISSRGGMLRQQKNIAAVLDIVETVQKKVKVNMESMHTQMQGLLAVLSPIQQAKFLVWVEEGMSGNTLMSKVRNVLEFQHVNKGATVDDSQSLSLSDLDSLSSQGFV